MDSAALRRLAVLSSHLRPDTETSEELKGLFSGVSPSNCASDIEVNQEIECIFCKIIRGQAPALKVYEDDICLCILDSNPLSHGHSLVIPKCHFSTLEATPSEVVAAMCSKVPFISKAVMNATGSGGRGTLFKYSCFCLSARTDGWLDSFNLLVNNGAAAGQVVFHTHIHIIPRKTGDCLWASESLRRRKLKLDQEAIRLARNIRDRLQIEDNFEDSKGQGSSLIGG